MTTGGRQMRQHVRMTQVPQPSATRHQNAYKRHAPVLQRATRQRSVVAAAESTESGCRRALCRRRLRRGSRARHTLTACHHVSYGGCGAECQQRARERVVRCRLGSMLRVRQRRRGVIRKHKEGRCGGAVRSGRTLRPRHGGSGAKRRTAWHQRCSCLPCCRRGAREGRKRHCSNAPRGRVARRRQRRRSASQHATGSALGGI